MVNYPVSSKNKIKRIPARAAYDQDTIFEIIDSTILCHVAFKQNEQVFLIPMVFCRMDDRIILHGAKTSRLLQALCSGVQVTISFTTIQSLVMARSAFHHSVNYRSVIVYGSGREIQSENDKMSAMAALVEHIAKGRWEDCRKPNKKELNATTIVEIKIEDASAKQRSGPPIDDDDDYNLDHWAGLIEIAKSSAFENDAKLTAGIEVPDYLMNYQIKY
ncbi:MAG: pyridoxamine 5'-phosphate oxidase family protein [Calditrichaeota bacterium]|nr:pyridoxamine 5'-phosphate oxidase family protein [Calditrichota bacterium]